VKPTAPERQLQLQRRSVQTVEETNQVLGQFTAEEQLPDFHPRVVTALSPVAALREELKQGYDLVFLGAGRRRMAANRMLSAVLEEGGPDVVLLSGESFPRSFKRILIATAGGFAARGAAELAILYGKAAGAQVHAVHIVEAAAAGPSTHERQLTVGTRLVADVTALGEKSGVRVDSWVRQEASSPRAILGAAQEVGADLVIVGAIPRVLGRRLYLGNTAEYVLGHAHAAVAVFVPGMRRAVAARAA
jgi:nucleotide-binding universal stress UspA family protein